MATMSRILMMTYSQEAENARTALSSGAIGYLIHGQFDPQDLYDAVRATAAGRSVLSSTALLALTSGAGRESATGEPSSVVIPTSEPLTSREAQIAALIVAGLLNPEICEQLFLGESTVKNHINRIFRKAGVTTRDQLVKLARGR
jgi:DNA-binding NarL/FixJ family response regulator